MFYHANVCQNDAMISSFRLFRGEVTWKRETAAWSRTPITGTVRITHRSIRYVRTAAQETKKEEDQILDGRRRRDLGSGNKTRIDLSSGGFRPQKRMEEEIRKGRSSDIFPTLV